MNMESHRIHPARVKRLNQKNPSDGDYVLYWMQHCQREQENHALEYAIEQANLLSLPVVVCFGLAVDYPEANLRHYAFMIEGLRDVKSDLHKRTIPFVVRQGFPPEVALRLGRRASVIVCDRGYLRHLRDWRRIVAKEASCAVIQVESDLIVPVETVSQKREYAARTFRPKISKLVPRFLDPPVRLAVSRKTAAFSLSGMDIDDNGVFDVLSVSEEVKPVPMFRGGAKAGYRILKEFIRKRLEDYAHTRNQPQTDNVSHMSKYLHFGQISPAAVARLVQGSPTASRQNSASFLDELIVRRELTYNFVYNTSDYDRYSCIPEWAAQTLARHREDPREQIYTRSQLEHGKTHDRYWNAAMKEMRDTGYMHNYMRMYWGKKILEWTNTPAHAYKTALYLNNKYFIDGRDPNSYANIGWIFGLHDRPWKERTIYGKTRTMTAQGLERKGHPEQYVEKVEQTTS